MTRDNLEKMRADAERYRYLCQYRGWPEDIEAALECGSKDLIDAAIDERLAREGWTPPEPVDPDLLAFREWGERRFGVNTASAYRLGDCDDTALAKAYLAGARMAREQERERAKELVEFIGRVRPGVFNNLDHANHEARKVLAKYQGEA